MKDPVYRLRIHLPDGQTGGLAAHSGNGCLHRVHAGPEAAGAIVKNVHGHGEGKDLFFHCRRKRFDLDRRCLYAGRQSREKNNEAQPRGRSCKTGCTLDQFLTPLPLQRRPRISTLALLSDWTSRRHGRCRLGPGVMSGPSTGCRPACPWQSRRGPPCNNFPHRPAPRPPSSARRRPRP